MSEKKEDKRTPENTRITRQQIQQNPELKNLLTEPLEELAFRRCSKVARSPPRETTVKQDKKEENAQNTNTNLGAIPKTTVTKFQEKLKKSGRSGENKNISAKIDTGLNKNKKEVEKNQSNQAGAKKEDSEKLTQEQTLTNEENSDSLLNIVWEQDKNDRYSDIGGILAEQSLIVGTSKDIQNNGKNSNNSISSVNFNNFQLTEANYQLINLEDDSADLNNVKIINDVGNLAKTKKQDETQQVNNSKSQIINTRKMTGPGVSSENQNRAAVQPLKLSLKDLANYVPEYDGKNMTPTEYIKKLKQVKHLVDEVDEPCLTRLLKVRMRGEPEEALSGSNIVNIEQLIEGVRTLYPNEDDLYELYAKVKKIIQGSDETIIQYTNRMRKLAIKIKELKKAEKGTQDAFNLFENELDREVARSYKKGLRAEIKYELGQENTLPELSKAAIEIEADLKRRRGVVEKTINYAYETPDETYVKPMKILICQLCGERQHEALLCRNANCAYCKGIDHFSNSCRNVTNKLKLICKFCGLPGHTVSACRLNRLQNNHCQYCQDMGHEANNCTIIKELEICWKCMEIGHEAKNCVNTQKPKIQQCEICNSTGHELQHCPDIICSRCNKKGHAVKNCKLGEEKSFFQICSLCEETGHNITECNTAKILMADYKAKQQIKCQLCEETGHSAKYCKKYNDQQSMQRINGNNYNQNFQRKFCEFCKMKGHVAKECKKIIALQRRAQDNQQIICQFCDKIGHKIENCEVIKALQAKQGEFCRYCKKEGHVIEKCYRLKSKQENSNTLPGGNA